MQLFASVVAALAVSVISHAQVHAADFCDLIRCTKEAMPVCGSNNVTYDNACMFSIAKCGNDKLSIASNGTCKGEAPAPIATVATVAPSPSIATIAPIPSIATIAPSPSIATIAPTPSLTTAAPTPSPRPSTTAKPIAVCEIMCIDMYKPVCGSDGETYGNRCKLQLASCNLGHSTPASSITVASEGECPAAGGDEDVVTVGPATDAPRNNSDASAGNDGDVVKPSEPTVLCEMLCAMSYDPVCGSDGKTYSNSCELRRASCQARVKLTEVSKGECAGADAPTPSSSSPSPSTPSPSATAEPTAKPANVTTAPAPASTPRTCSQMCTEEYSPVCGTDGKTYANKCRFNVAKCTTGITTMAIASEGACAASEADVTAAPSTTEAPASGAVAGSCNRACPRMYRPVCGSDGVTYSNKCSFEVAKCTKRISSIAMTSEDGECSA